MSSPKLETGIVTHPIAQDWDRYFERDMGRGNRYQADVDIYNEMVSLALNAEHWGYDYVFAPEHHVSPYGLSVNPLQFMTYLAGRTTRINFGTSIVVLPWWNPLRVAEELAFLDNLAPDRKKLIGVGRGVAPFEYAAMSIPYDDRRERNDEAIEIIRLALTQESFSYDGEVFHIPEVTLRPRPVNADLVDSLLIAATSDETLIEGGRRGLGLIYAGQKSTGLTRADVAMLNRERVENGFGPIQPVILTWLMCCRSEQEAHERIVQATSGLLFDLTNNYAQILWDQFDRDAGYDVFVQRVQGAASKPTSRRSNGSSTTRSGDARAVPREGACAAGADGCPQRLVPGAVRRSLPRRGAREPDAVRTAVDRQAAYDLDRDARLDPRRRW